MRSAPRVYHDADADLGELMGLRVAVLGYGNQGRSQALNLRDSGVDLLVGAPEDGSRARAAGDGFAPVSLAEAAERGDWLLLLLPDEELPELFEADIRPRVAAGNGLVFASGYAVAFGSIPVPEGVDVVLLAPRLFGPGVRERFEQGVGFPSFVGVHRDVSGRAWPRLLALAKAIGSTRAGCLELSFRDEAALDLFNEQGFGPAFGHVLVSALQTLVEAGFPPETALLELLHSGEFEYALERMRREGVMEQMEHHSHTSQYGSMTRAIRFLDLDLRSRMAAILADIQSGQFAEEWRAERAAGLPNYEKLRAARKQHPLHEWDQRTRALLSGERGGEG